MTRALVCRRKSPPDKACSRSRGFRHPVLPRSVHEGTRDSLIPAPHLLTDYRCLEGSRCNLAYRLHRWPALSPTYPCRILRLYRTPFPVHPDKIPADKPRTQWTSWHHSMFHACAPRKAYNLRRCLSSQAWSHTFQPRTGYKLLRPARRRPRYTFPVYMRDRQQSRRFVLFAYHKFRANMEYTSTTLLRAGTSRTRSSYTLGPRRPSRFRQGTLHTFRRQAWCPEGTGCRRIDLLLWPRYRQDSRGTLSARTRFGRSPLHTSCSALKTQQEFRHFQICRADIRCTSTPAKLRVTS